MSGSVRTSARRAGGASGRGRRKLPPFPYERRVLSSGLPVVLSPRASVSRVAVALFLRVGSRFETVENNGISHFLEHMIYRGNRRHATAHEQSLAFERLGTSLYAATATDHGVMSLSLPRETVAEGVGLLGEVVCHPRFSAIETERRIVHEEILEGLDDDRRSTDPDNLVRALAWPDHPLGLPITGTLEHLAAFDVRKLRAHHARHYVVKNAAIAVAGAFSPEPMMELLEHAFAELPQGKPARHRASPPPAPGAEPRVSYVDSDASQTDVRLLFRGPGEHDRREPAAEMLLRLIDDGMSTRLYERICDEKGLCYAVSAGYETFADDGAFDFAAEMQHGRTAEVIEEVLAICTDLAEKGPTEAELDKARDRCVWGFSSMLDSADDLAAFSGLAELAGIARTPKARAEEILAVTRAELRDEAARMFSPSGLSAVAVGLLPKDVERRFRHLVTRFGR